MPTKEIKNKNPQMGERKGRLQKSITFETKLVHLEYYDSKAKWSLLMTGLLESL